MPHKATHVYTGSQNPPAYGPDDRLDDLALTPLGLKAAREMPTLDELLKRKGAKGLQQCVDELTYAYFNKHGWDWIYANGKVFCQRQLYFIQLPDQVHYLGSFRNAVSYFLDALAKGSYNHAMRRAR